MNDVRKFLEIEAAKDTPSNDLRWAAMTGVAEAWLEMLYSGQATIDDFRKKVERTIQNMPSEATESPVTHF